MNKIDRLRGKLIFFKNMNMLNFVYFLYLAWMNLIGKIGIITSKEEVSRGGYKYLSIVISRLPVSKNHKYN